MGDRYLMLPWIRRIFHLTFFGEHFLRKEESKMKNSYFHLSGCLLRLKQNEAIETEHLYFTKEEFKSLILLSGKLKRHQGVSENKD